MLFLNGLEKIERSVIIEQMFFMHRTNMAEIIDQRIGEISAAETVEFMIRCHIGRCRPLVNNRKGQYAVDLVHPYRLVFDVNDKEIQIANIIEIVDYH